MLRRAKRWAGGDGGKCKILCNFVFLKKITIEFG